MNLSFSRVKHAGGFAALLVLLWFSAVPVQAEDSTYKTEISAPDRANSRGAALKTLREFLRQDRFNVHTQRHVDPGDTTDGNFGSVEARALIDGARLVLPAGLEASVIEGKVSKLVVTISGSGKTLELRVDEAKELPPPSVPELVAVKPAGFLVAYRTTLGQQDLVDSNGVSLSRLRAFLGRDRTNVNVLGHPDPGDERDATFTSARQRGRFESAAMLVDPALVSPLLSRQPVAVAVYVDGEERLIVTRPGSGPGIFLRTLEDMVEEQGGTVSAMIVARAKGAEASVRELVDLAGLTYGREHEKTVLFRVNLARFLMEQKREAEVVPMLAGIEKEFRAAAEKGVEETSVFPVMSFLVETRFTVGETAAAEKLLEELLDEPGSLKWKLSEAQRVELGELRKGLDPSAQVQSDYDSLVKLAFQDYREGRFVAARQRCKEIISLLNSPESQEMPAGISARALLVGIATAEGNAAEAESLARLHFEWAAKLFRPYDGRLMDLGLQFMELLADRGDWEGIEKAGSPLAEAALKATEAPYADLRVAWHRSIAEMLFAAGLPEKADQWYRRVFDVVKRDPSLAPTLAESYSSWGFLYETEGQYNRAETIWSEGAKQVESIPERVSDYIDLLQDLSLVRKHYRDDEGAIDLIERARSLASDAFGTDSIEYAVSCNNLVIPLNALGRRDHAIRMSDESLRVAAAFPDREWGETNALIFQNNRAILLMNTDPGGAAAIYEGIVAKMEARQLEGTQDFAIFLMNLGTALKQTGRTGEAEAALLRSLEVLRHFTTVNPRNSAVIQGTLAELALERGDAAAAVDRVRESLTLSDAYLENAFMIASESEKLSLSSFFDYGKFIHILLKAGEMKEACELSLRIKGTVLDQSIRDLRTMRRIAEDEEMKSRFAELRTRQRQLTRVSLALQQGGGAAPDLPALAILRDEVKRLQGELLAGSEGGTESSSPVNLEAVQQRLGKGDRFLDFVQATNGKGDQYLGAFEISASTLRWVELAPLEVAQQAVSDFREEINALMKSRNDAGVAAALEEASRTLNRLFWEPFVFSGELSARVVLCPDGLLHFVPFAVLLDAEGRFPGEKLVLDYVVSARDFGRVAADGKHDLSSAVIVGGPDYRFPLPGVSNDAIVQPAPRIVELARRDVSVRSGIARSGRIALAPLPGAVKEAQLIAETLTAAGAKVTLYTAAEATEQALAGAAGPGIVHIATHGVFFDLNFDSLVIGEYQAGVDPMLRGALALTGAQTAVGSWEHSTFPDVENDGWLFAAEALQLDLGGTELVTLSACETGVGSVASGEGVIGLRRAFLAAGAKNVLSTLWPISDDMTVELMRDL